jgi:hypothetical protein
MDDSGFFPGLMKFASDGFKPKKFSFPGFPKSVFAWIDDALQS